VSHARWRPNFVAFVSIALAALAVARLRPPLNAAFLGTKNQDDVYTLPPTGQLVAMSVGYRSALADMIFAHVLVSAGIHFQEKRAFEFVDKYIEAVNALDPKFELPYRMADGLITLQAKPVSVEAYRQARRILERGMAEFPYSQELWSSAGMFLAYLGPTGNIEGNELAEWKLAGGRALARSCELVGSKELPPQQCIVAAGLLSKAGEAAAAQQFIERMLALNDDPEVRRFMGALLQQKAGESERERLQERREQFKRAWSTDLPFVSRGAALTIGPRWDSAACAGAAECVTSWRAWAAAIDQQQGRTSRFGAAPGAIQ
jgi:tetratricopeptide (TPR) repeat protein